MSRVAIGMPIWNGEKLVSKAIESILGQTYGDLKLVISDNASTDATADICRLFAKRDKRVRYIRLASNIGAAPNFCSVFHQSSGHFFKWAAHDDVLAPEFIQKCVRIMDADETVILCSPATMLINEDGSPLVYSPEYNVMVDTSGAKWPLSPEKNLALMASDPVDRFAAVLLNMVMCYEIFGLIRRPVLERSALLAGYAGGDKVLLAELSLMGRFHLLEESLFSRRCHSGQFSQARSGAYRSKWFSGKKDHVFSQQLKLLAGYLRVVLSADLTPQERYQCVAAVFRRSVTRGRLIKRMFVPVAD